MVLKSTRLGVSLRSQVVLKRQYRGTSNCFVSLLSGTVVRNTKLPMMSSTHFVGKNVMQILHDKPEGIRHTPKGSTYKHYCFFLNYYLVFFNLNDVIYFLSRHT